MTEKFPYIVAFRGISLNDGHKGIVTWTQFESKDAFDLYWKDADKTLQEIAGEGITAEGAAELTLATPVQSRINAAIMDSRNPMTGDFDLEYLNGKLADLGYFLKIHARAA